MSRKLWSKNKTDLSPEPPLMQSLLLEPHLKKVENLLQLTLQLILVVLESFSRVVILVDLSVKNFIPGLNPWRMEEEELVCCLVYKVFISAVVARCNTDILFV
jgi:hypothetical protein